MALLNWLHYIQIWPTDGATCISYKFSHQMALVALVTNLVLLAQSGWVTFIDIITWYWVGIIRQIYIILFSIRSLALVLILAIRWRHLHKLQTWPPGWVTCIATLAWIALLVLSVSIELVSSSARVKLVKFHKRLLERTRHIDRTRRPGSDKNQFEWCEIRNTLCSQPFPPWKVSIDALD